jgi:predicted nucleotidyltransferase
MIGIPREKLDAFCRQWRVTELALFGSALRDDFGPESDVDVLIEFDSQARWTLLDFVQMRDELAEVFGREVDLVSRRAIEESRNPFRRRNILESAQVIYAA